MLGPARRAHYNAIVAELHELQRRGTITAAALNALYPQMTEAATKFKDSSSVPATAKTQFEALHKQFDAVRVKFGVQPPAAGGRGAAGGGGGRGGRGGAAVDPANVLGRTGALKTALLSIWESRARH